ncbi:MAG TPA: hypothetical protein VGB77_03270 [Abditibacteriaceae bacterium]|jgi:hypothetical protein
MAMEKPTRRKTPYEKKQDVYDKDRFGTKEMPHLFRKAKPRKKKGVNRQERSRARNLIRSAILESQEENLTTSALKKVADPIGNFPWKGARPVREIIARKMQSRALRTQFRACKKHKAAPLSLQDDV